MTPSIAVLNTLHKQLHEPILFNQPKSSCSSCQETLPAFIMDELTGFNVDNTYPKIAYHLDICTLCLRQYLAISQLSVNAFHSPS